MLMEESWGWKRPGENMNSWGWSMGMKALESLEGGTVVEGEDFQFTGCETECCQATEQLRC